MQWGARVANPGPFDGAAARSPSQDLLLRPLFYKFKEKIPTLSSPPSSRRGAGRFSSPGGGSRWTPVGSCPASLRPQRAPGALRSRGAESRAPAPPPGGSGAAPERPAPCAPPGAAARARPGPPGRGARGAGRGPGRGLRRGRAASIKAAAGWRLERAGRARRGAPEPAAGARTAGLSATLSPSQRPPAGGRPVSTPALRSWSPGAAASRRGKGAAGAAPRRGGQDGVRGLRPSQGKRRRPGLCLSSLGCAVRLCRSVHVGLWAQRLSLAPVRFPRDSGVFGGRQVLGRRGPERVLPCRGSARVRTARAARPAQGQAEESGGQGPTRAAHQSVGVSPAAGRRPSARARRGGLPSGRPSASLPAHSGPGLGTRRELARGLGAATAYQMARAPLLMFRLRVQASPLEGSLVVPGKGRRLHEGST